MESEAVHSALYSTAGENTETRLTYTLMLAVGLKVFRATKISDLVDTYSEALPRCDQVQFKEELWRNPLLIFHLIGSNLGGGRNSRKIYGRLIERFVVSKRLVHKYMPKLNEST